MMRTLTRLEARLLGLTPGEADTMNQVLAGGEVHPHHFSKGYRSLLGMGRGRIVKVLGVLDIRGADIVTGNDAPRGGAEGKWIKLSPSGRAKARRRLASNDARCHCGRSMPQEIISGGHVWACQFCSPQCASVSA